MREIDEKISRDLEAAAKEEFLNLGYNQASLRSIVSKCGVSTQTIYLRYGNKEGLFDHLVKDTGQAFLDFFKDLHQGNYENQDFINHSSKATDQVLDYIYDHFEDFKLIFCRSEGSQYETYLDKLVQIEEESLMAFLKSADHPDLEDLEFFVHKKATEGINDLYEIVNHDLDRESAIRYMDLVKRFRFAGWREILA